MEDKEYISEGHYRDNKGNDFMSIWTFKRKHGITEGDNSKEALAISCSDKFRAPFNASNKFKEGYMYSVDCLNKFYKI